MIIQPRLFKDFRKVEELLKLNGKKVWRDYSARKLPKLKTELFELKVLFDKAKEKKNVKEMLSIKQKADVLRREMEFYS